jgi:hypothetical protein
VGEPGIESGDMKQGGVSDEVAYVSRVGRVCLEFEHGFRDAPKMLRTRVRSILKALNELAEFQIVRLGIIAAQIEFRDEECPSWGAGIGLDPAKISEAFEVAHYAVRVIEAFREERKEVDTGFSGPWVFLRVMTDSVKRASDVPAQRLSLREDCLLGSLRDWICE